MPEVFMEQAVAIPHATLLRRLEQSEDLRDFAIQMWLQNPNLALQGGERVRQLLIDLAAVPPAPTFAWEQSETGASP
jgi:hypothetical protein